MKRSHLTVSVEERRKGRKEGEGRKKSGGCRDATRVVSVPRVAEEVNVTTGLDCKRSPRAVPPPRAALTP